jgi:1,4-alpha-glucan branching enzyme
VPSSGNAVILDVVYNHAGGGLDDESLVLLDRQPEATTTEFVAFTDQGWAGGKCLLESGRPIVPDRQRAVLSTVSRRWFPLDEVTVIDRFGGWHWRGESHRRVAALQARSAAHRRAWADQQSASSTAPAELDSTPPSPSGPGRPAAK